MSENASTRGFKLLTWFTFLAFALWWIFFTFISKDPTHSSIHYKFFGATYGILSVIGGVIGILASKKWGGYKSLLGRALMFFALGLFAQAFGQIAYSVYVYILKIDIPYPSVGDIGYFGSELFYIYAAFLLAKATGIRFSLKDKYKKAIAIILPLALLAGSYIYFLRGYQFDWHHPLTIFLDFGYPLGEAVYISIALVAFLLSRKFLGGIMKNKILIVLFALLIQYVADFAFLNAAKKGTFYASGANDFVYLVAYTVMALALNTFRMSLNTAASPTQQEVSE